MPGKFSKRLDATAAPNALKAARPVRRLFPEPVQNLAVKYGRPQLSALHAMEQDASGA